MGGECICLPARSVVPQYPSCSETDESAGMLWRYAFWNGNRYHWRCSHNETFHGVRILAEDITMASLF